MIELILSMTVMERFVALMYLLPAALCLVGYAALTVREVFYDRHMRALRPVTYYPTVHLGDVLARLIIAVIPVVSILCLLFDIVPDLFRETMRHARKLGLKPLVARPTDRSEEQ